MKPRKPPRNRRVVVFNRNIQVAASVKLMCYCAQRFDTEAEMTKHLRFAERRPHEKHRRAFVCV